MLNILKYRLVQNNIFLEFTPNLIQYIIDSSYSYEYGARPIKRFIQREIETIVAKGIIKGEIVPNCKTIIDYQNDEVVIRVER